MSRALLSSSSSRASGSKGEPPWRAPLVGKAVSARWLLVMRRQEVGPSNLYSRRGKSISLNWHEEVTLQMNPQVYRV